ncbi:ThiF family adenylyltransferase [Fulvivirga lutea]|uniref:Molybdopterin-synthase adenylyltransferase n=1 Tax=Fulvivirga lutea TaxID=2810512 RepID=A0A974ZZX4_9BACT|nr:ThiF family adenylyltransferase [Fulvivirga lutea]QSE96610.1 ThiF family adenylyltransferase [Fulvivirga lutea]
MLSKEEIQRYQRHFPLPDFGVEAQEKLKKSKVLIVGCGGLGNPVSSYLAASGVSCIGLIDSDVVSISNLQRQILYKEQEIGISKVRLTAQKLKELNHHVEIEEYNLNLNSKNALSIIDKFDLVIDCTDNFPTRYLINDACILQNKPFIYGSIYQYEGQVAVFNVNKSANYRDLYPTPPNPESVPDCEIGGVLGTLPGIIGSIQANEAIKVICGIGQPLIEKLFIFDSQSMETRVIKIKNTNARDTITGLIDYEEFCHPNKNKMVKEITVKELHEMIENKEDFQLIDVREPHEVEIATLDGELIPLGDIPQNEDKIAKNKKVVVHCRSGARSGQAIQYLQGKLGLENLYNLKGGILAWADEIDPSMEKY